MTKRLSEKGVAALRPKRRSFVTWDSAVTGLGLKVTSRGTKVWLAQLKYPGQKFRSKVRLGLFPALGLVEAREKARAWHAMVRGGTDPRAVEAAQQKKQEDERCAEAVRQENTFGAMAETWIAGRTNRHAPADAAHVRRLLLPEWGSKALHELKPRDVREVFARLIRRSGHDARCAWSHASQIFRLAVHHEAIEVSPMASLDKRLVFVGVSFAPRQRMLSDEELFAFWRASGRMPYPFGPFYRLLLLTACRKNELAKARRSELHPELRRLLREKRQPGMNWDWSAIPADVKVLVVPRQRFKSDAEHRVCLTDDALRVLETLPQFAGCDYLFTNDGSSSAWMGNKIKRELDARILRTLKALARQRGDDPEAVVLAPWVNHDLRRNVKSGMAALKIDDRISEMTLGHGKKGLQRVYDQHEYADQIRDALERWAARVRVITASRPSEPPPVVANVVPLRSSRRR